MKRLSPERLVAIALVATSLYVWMGVAGNGFISFDDHLYVCANPHVRSGLTFDGMLWAFRAFHATNWHPMTWLSHMLDCELFGLNPAGHHLISLFFHIANALLLLLLLQKATGRIWESAAVAFLFALHPLRVESVAWISERKDVLSGFFAMLTMLAYVEYVRQHSQNRYVLTLFCFATGLMAKPMLVSLPFVLLLLDFWPLQRIRDVQIAGRVSKPFFPSSSGDPDYTFGRLVIEKIPFFLLSAASSVITFQAQHQGGALSTFEVVPLRLRVVNALVSYWEYLGKIIFPSDLVAFYPYQLDRLFLWQGLAATAFLAAVSLLVVFQARRRPFLFTGWFWFLVMLVPVIGIVQAGAQSMADRYTYLPSIGILIGIVWTIPSLPGRVFHNRFLLAAGFTTAVILLSHATRYQIGLWKNTETLFGHAASVTKGNYLAHYLLGGTMEAKNELDAAQSEYEKALAIWPHYHEAHRHLGMVLTKKGLHSEAMSHYEEALRINPTDASSHLTYADVLVEQGDLDGAAFHYLEAIRIDSDLVEAHNGLGVVTARMQKMDDAVLHLRRAIELCPQCAEPHNNLGRLLTIQGDIEKAAIELLLAIELSPDFAEAHNNLALLYLKLGAIEDALYHAARALHLRPHYEKARANLKRIVAVYAQPEGIEGQSE
jgi:tetratricopeptide (TPR) repeat protein